MKKVVTGFLVLAMLLQGSFVHALEAETLESKALEVEELCYEMDLAHAVFTDENGVEIPLEVTYEVQAFPSVNNRRTGGTTTYAITATATAKPKSDSKDNNDNNVSISIRMTMWWIDVFGDKNILESLEGGYTLKKGTVTGSNIYWGASEATATNRNLYGAANFNEQINWTSNSTFFGRIWSKYLVKYSGGTIQLEIEPTIFD